MPLEIDSDLTLGMYYDSDGYMFFCCRDTSVSGKKDKKYAMYEHRLLGYAWDKLDSVFFSNDMREIHHIDNPKDLNTEINLQAVTPEEHKEIDSQRANLTTAWDRTRAGD